MGMPDRMTPLEMTSSQQDPRSTETARVPLVSAIILNYRNYAETIECVRGLLFQDYPALSCVVVDNASPNDSLSQLQRAFSSDARVKIVLAERNGGYATGNNIGARWAIAQQHPKYLFIVNPDIRMPDTQTLGRLVDFASKQPDMGATSPKVVLPNGFVQGPYKRPSLVLTCVQYLFPPLWFILRRMHQYNAQRMRAPQRCFRTIGACMLLDAGTFEEAGMFDEGTFLESEEPILAERIANHSKYFYHLPEVTVIHHHSRSGGRVDAINSLEYYFKVYRGASSFSLALLRSSESIYRKIYEPLRRPLGISE